MPRPPIALAFALTTLATPALADNGVDYCIHREAVNAIAARGIDVTGLFKETFTMDEMKPLITTCEGSGRLKSPIFSKNREYTHVTVEQVGAKESLTGIMTAVPKYRY